MKRIISFMLMLAIVCCYCFPMQCFAENSVPDFKRLNDSALIGYMEDTIYSALLENLEGEEYFVENVSAVYISQEYIDELEYNSRVNIFFGYSLDELAAQFKDDRYVFTLGDDGQTVVQPFEDANDIYNTVIKNVAIGSGVILICVTVSVATAGAAPAMSLIFAASAKTATVMAASGAALGAVSAGVVTGIQTHDFDEALEAAAVGGSEGFKWGAISGAIAGGGKAAMALKGATLNGLTMNEAAAIQKESGYPLDVIKQFRSMDQYNICKEAGLKPDMIGNRIALIRNIDLTYTDEFGRTNLQRMQQGLAAIDPDTGLSYQLHHIGQQQNSTLAILTESEHMQHGNNQIWHLIGKATEIDRDAFSIQRSDFWIELAGKLAA